jgi:hypothetical protein
MPSENWCFNYASLPWLSNLIKKITFSLWEVRDSVQCVESGAEKKRDQHSRRSRSVVVSTAVVVCAMQQGSSGAYTIPTVITRATKLFRRIIGLQLALGLGGFRWGGAHGDTSQDTRQAAALFR